MRKECWLKKKRGTDNKFKEDMPEAMLVEKWQKFLDVQVKLSDHGETAALAEMLRMCPGETATLEDIEKACRETPFRTPFWKGKTADTDIPERVLSPAEVDVINRKYLELNAAFLEKAAWAEHRRGHRRGGAEHHSTEFEGSRVVSRGASGDKRGT